MQAEVTLTLVGTFPDGLQVGDVLRLEGAVTVHTIKAEMVDVSDFNAAGANTYLPTVREVGVYSNDVRFVATREP